MRIEVRESSVQLIKSQMMAFQAVAQSEMIQNSGLSKASEDRGSKSSLKTLSSRQNFNFLNNW